MNASRPSIPATTVHVGSITPRDDLLQARPTQRVSQRIEADGDTWQETLAVCEASASNTNGGLSASGQKKKKQVPAGGGPLIMRSYFQNTRTGQRVWDEPPSGASHILQATEEMRRMAELQMSELTIVTAASATSTTGTGGDVDASTKRKATSRGGFFGLGKKKEKDITGSATAASSSHPTTANATPAQRIRYRPGSLLLAGRHSTPSNRNAARGAATMEREDQDTQLQEAIARSLAESQGMPYYSTVSPVAAASPGSYGNTHANRHFYHDKQPATVPGAEYVSPDDDELAMAKALSLLAVQESGETDEQLLERVLEQSRLEDAIQRGTFQAQLSEPEENDLLGMMVYDSSSSPSLTSTAIHPEEDDRKLPASSFSSGPAATNIATSTTNAKKACPNEAGPAPLLSYKPSSPAVVFPKTLATPILDKSASSRLSAPRSPPVSPMFDPYAKDAPSAASRILMAEKEQAEIGRIGMNDKNKNYLQQESLEGLYLDNGDFNNNIIDSSADTNPSALQKMNPHSPGKRSHTLPVHSAASASVRLNFGKRSPRSTKKIQDRAGLV